MKTILKRLLFAICAVLLMCIILITLVPTVFIGIIIWVINWILTGRMFDMFEDVFGIWSDIFEYLHDKLN